MRFDSYDTQERNTIRETQSEDVAGDEPAAGPRRRPETLARWLDAGELGAGFVTNLSPLGKQLRVLLFPGGEIGTAIESRQSPATNDGIQAADLGLGYGEGNKGYRALVRIVKVTPELFEGQASRFGVIDTVFYLLSVEVAYVTRHIAGEKAGAPSSHGITRSAQR
ncbi:MAG TPA: hypothetical protein VK899_08210 [Gemmatimonadales bacterium]|nr:hypothetical protein [Gemmatimonadales bacterium]